MLEHTSGYLAARTMLIVGIAFVAVDLTLVFIAFTGRSGFMSGDRATWFGLPVDLLYLGVAGVILPLLALGVMYRIYRGAREADETWRSLGR